MDLVSLPSNNGFHWGGYISDIQNIAVIALSSSGWVTPVTLCCITRSSVYTLAWERAPMPQRRLGTTGIALRAFPPLTAHFGFVAAGHGEWTLHPGWQWLPALNTNLPTLPTLGLPTLAQKLSVPESPLPVTWGVACWMFMMWFLKYPLHTQAMHLVLCNSIRPTHALKSELLRIKLK